MIDQITKMVQLVFPEAVVKDVEVSGTLRRVEVQVQRDTELYMSFHLYTLPFSQVPEMVLNLVQGICENMIKEETECDSQN